jgi:hypothetical protein
MFQNLRERINAKVGPEQLEINWEVTERLAKEEKYIRFNKWCDDNGIVRPSLRYPTAFGKDGRLIGISTKRTIGFNESFLFVPAKLFITEENFTRHPQLSKLIDEHEELQNELTETYHLLMIFFLLYELCKGPESFWFPYFEITDKPDLIADWPVKELNNLQDETMKERTLEEEEENRACFATLRKVAEAHPDIFNLKEFTYARFKQAKNLCDSRCFGYSLPLDMIVPFADCANHHIVDMTVEIFNKRLHEKVSSD